MKIAPIGDDGQGGGPIQPGKALAETRTVAGCFSPGQLSSVLDNLAAQAAASSTTESGLRIADNGAMRLFLEVADGRYLKGVRKAEDRVELDLDSIQSPEQAVEATRTLLRLYREGKLSLESFEEMKGQLTFLSDMLKKHPSASKNYARQPVVRIVGASATDPEQQKAP